MAHDITVGATRGRRMDEALTALRPLVAVSEVSMSGDFFTLDRVRILPPPAPAVPIVIGGRSDAALRRVARHGDGWLGLWVSPRRYADASGRISRYASDAGREVTQWRHGMHVWCAFGTAAAARAASRSAVRTASVPSIASSWLSASGIRLNDRQPASTYGSKPAAISSGVPHGQ